MADGTTGIAIPEQALLSLSRGIARHILKKLAN
jgi:hypothetical protein